MVTATSQRELTETQVLEWKKCQRSSLYFIHTYVTIYDALIGGWIPFDLWPMQASTLKIFQLNRLVVVLKSRQIGLTWLALGFALWLMIFHPAVTILLFSRRDDEAIDLLDFRLKGMYKRLPDWMHAREVLIDSKHEWALSNGSRAKAFPTTAGDSYTATLVICDEFDLVPDQNGIMEAVKPTIDNGGRMILLSRADKDKPLSQFKAIYKAAKARLNDWIDVFLPWFAHPGRDRAWYESQKMDIQARTGSNDELHQQYPETDDQALAGRTLDKRIPPAWVQQCYQEMRPVFVGGHQAKPPVEFKQVPAIEGLKIFRWPEDGSDYVMGADPAEGLPTSDDSSLTVLDVVTLEEVARIDGKFDPKHTFPRLIDQIGHFYNDAPVLVERNNHGHAVIGELETISRLKVIDGHDKRPGWSTNVVSKALMYDDGAAIFMNGETLLHDFGTQAQIGLINKNTLSAPEGEHDDKAVSYFLALKGAALRPSRTRVRAMMTGLPGRS